MTGKRSAPWSLIADGVSAEPWRTARMTLARRLLLANGLGTLAVVIHHATGWGMTAMFWWADSYRATSTLPDLAALDSFAYFVLMAASILTRFSVPTFFFVSGYFMGYGVKGTENIGRTYKVIRSRLVWLLIPYIVWSLVIFAARWLESCEESCHIQSLGGYARDLIFGRASGAYWYVFVLTILMILAPVLAELAKARWRALLAVTGFLLIGVSVIPYIGLVIPVPDLPQPLQLLLPLFNHAFYFAFGLVYRFHFDSFKLRASQLSVVLPFIIVGFAVLSLIDIEVWSRLDLDRDGLLPDHSHISVFTHGYALAIILSFISFEQVPVLLTGTLTALGSAVYGIYLIHPLLLEYLARAVHRLIPGFLAYPLAFQVYLVAGAIGLPLLLMSVVKHSPFKRYYRYLFG